MIALFFLVTHGLNGPVRGGLMLQPANGRTCRSEALITGAWATCGHRPFLRGRRRDETTEVQSLFPPRELNIGTSFRGSIPVQYLQKGSEGRPEAHRRERRACLDPEGAPTSLPEETGEEKLLAADRRETKEKGNPGGRVKNNLSPKWRRCVTSGVITYNVYN